MTDIGIRDISVSFHDNKISNISLVQGDALTRGFDITFVNAKGETLPVDDDYIVELVAVNSKDKDTPYACRHEIVDDKYRVMIPPEALSESGSITIQLVFYQKSTKAVIHTIKQKCPVYQSIGQEFVESNNLYVDITALRLGLEKIENLVADIQNKLDDGDFVGEKGDKGEQGVQGEQGPQGPPGEVKQEEFDNLSQEVAAHKEDYTQLITEVNKKANKVQEAWITPTLVNGWTGVVGQMPLYMKDTMGFVHLKGTIATGTLSTIIFHLPDGYRPSSPLSFPVIASNSFGRINIARTGPLVFAGGTPSVVYLDGIVYKGEF